MSSERLLTHLSAVETLLEEMAALLVKGDATGFEAAATALRQSMLELAHASAQEPSPTLRESAVSARLQDISRQLARQRDHLARRAVVTERGLEAVLPQRAVTYAAPGRGGVFRGATARIYTAPGF